MATTAQAIAAIAAAGGEAFPAASLDRFARVLRESRLRVPHEGSEDRTVSLGQAFHDWLRSNSIETVASKKPADVAASNWVKALADYRKAASSQDLQDFSTWRDLWPSGGKGGGKSAAHVRLHHLANLLMSMAGDQPIDALHAVMTLRRLRYAGREVIYRKHDQALDAPIELTGSFNTREEGSITFGSTLERLIADGRTTEWRNAWAVHRRGVELALCTRPASAEITWRSSDGRWSDHFLPPEQEIPFSPEAAYVERPGRRVTILPYAVITAAGELLQDTLARQTTTTTHENAETLPGASAPTRDQSTARTNGKPGLRTPERSGESEKFQPPPCVRTGRETPPWSDRDEHPHSSHQARP
jgi:hypothetical protein